MAGVPHTETRVWAGLGRSPFLADVDPGGRDWRRIGAVLVGGGLVGLTAAAAGEVLIGAACTVAAGRGREGVEGLGRTLRLFNPDGSSDPWVNLLDRLLDTGANGLFALGFVAFAALIARRPFHRYVTAARSLRWRLWAVGFVAFLLLAAPLAAADRILATGGSAPLGFAASPGWTQGLAWGAGALLLVPAAAAEELIFRGWLPRQVAAFTRRPGPLIGASAVLFAAAHFDPTPDGFLTRVMMGAGFAYMTLRLGGLELAIAAHAANNVAIVLLLPPSVPPRGAVEGGLTPASLIFDLVMLAGYVAVTEALARIALLRTWAGVEAADLSPTA